jgi:hypothetical protein
MTKDRTADFLDCASVPLEMTFTRCKCKRIVRQQNRRSDISKRVRKSSKKIQKKACQDLGASARGEFERLCPSFRRSKKNQKSEKKACQGLRNLISLPKPNQTNGETND